MNKLTKIGVTALCGTLAGITAANAGALSVAGGATVTYTTGNGKATVGNPFGMASNYTFSGSGELDNGSTFSVSSAYDDKGGYSASNISITTPSFGTIRYDEGGGTGIDRYDDMMPTAWEETSGTGITSGLRTVSGVGGGSDIEWTVPTSMTGGMDVHLSYSPRPDGSKPTDKASGGDTANAVDSAGWDIAIKSGSLIEGATLFAGWSEEGNSDGDTSSKVIGFTAAAGPLTFGFQHSVEEANAAAADQYVNNAFGISFAVNDDLSVSFGKHMSTKINPGDGTGLEDNKIDAKSLQIAYSMGGASFKIADTSVDNASYVSTTAGENDGTTVALSLAF
jgi:hypothetical protein